MRLKEAAAPIIKAFRREHHGAHNRRPDVIWCLEYLQAQLYPAPEMEEVEITWYMIVRTDGSFYAHYLNQKEAEQVVERTPAGVHLVEMKGSYRRPVPGRVKCREEISRPYEIGNHVYKDGTKFFAEWEE
jgi:hypothetical protein